tara:strand:- start:1496 stop:1744 length:249 start_codon:yes stop_codon:yes gene_type:complete
MSQQEDRKIHIHDVLRNHEQRITKSEKTGETMSSLETRLDEFETRIQQLVSENSTLKANLAELEGSFLGLSNKVDEVSSNEN